MLESVRQNSLASGIERGGDVPARQCRWPRQRAPSRAGRYARRGRACRPSTCPRRSRHGRRRSSLRRRPRARPSRRRGRPWQARERQGSHRRWKEEGQRPSCRLRWKRGCRREKVRRGQRRSGQARKRHGDRWWWCGWRQTAPSSQARRGRSLVREEVVCRRDSRSDRGRRSDRAGGSSRTPHVRGHVGRTARVEASRSWRGEEGRGRRGWWMWEVSNGGPTRPPFFRQGVCRRQSKGRKKGRHVPSLSEILLTSDMRGWEEGRLGRCGGREERLGGGWARAAGEEGSKSAREGEAGGPAATRRRARARAGSRGQGGRK